MQNQTAAPDQAPVDTVPITVHRYADLLLKEAMLTCLKNAGVAGWGGYDIAMEAFYNGRFPPPKEDSPHA